MNNSISVEEIKAIKPIIKYLLYGLKDIKENEIDIYLNKKISEYLPEKSEKEITEYTKNIIETIDRNNDNLEKLDKAKEKGITEKLSLQIKTSKFFQKLAWNSLFSIILLFQRQFRMQMNICIMLS